jgi:hypothetical protein
VFSRDNGMRVKKRSCYLQLPVSPGFAPGSLLIISELKYSSG